MSLREAKTSLPRVLRNSFSQSNALGRDPVPGDPSVDCACYRIMHGNVLYKRVLITRYFVPITNVCYCSVVDPDPDWI
jgi:hypothetical protein